MAFGTGHHETTRLALQMLAQALRAGDRVLDVGTGSGILSLVATRLGAGAVTGVDTDPLAVENACENLALNRLEGRVKFYRGAVSEVDGLFDLVVANIIRSVLVPMLPALKARLRGSGRLILGGVLDREETAFLGAVEAAGLAVEEVRHDGEWVGILAVKG
jgi:ribosomal protein L11 methyltransferase